MRTDDLVTLLAHAGGAVEAHAVRRRYAVAVGWGAFGATLLMALTLGVRPDLGEAARLPMFWIKLAFPAAMAGAALLAAVRLSRPGAGLFRAPLLVAAPVLAMWALAVAALVGAPGGSRAAMLMGFTWSECPWNIALTSVPAFVLALWAMQGLAPTRPALAGAASGLLAGAVGALAYALHCPEMDAPFLAIWYVAGMLIPTAAGAIIGPFVLRW
jgi:hypothetical protein